MLTFAQALKDKGVPVPDIAKKLTIGLDVPLVVGNLDRGLPAALFGAGPTEEGAAALSAHMRAARTAFATHGDPEWPAYESERRRTWIFAARPTVDRHPEEASRRIWAGQPLSALTLVEG
ncbi:hypothetical protein ACWGR4_33560 [Embleya sp. NPDC055664]